MSTRQRICEVLTIANFSHLQIGCGFHETGQSLFESSIDGIEVDDDIAGFVNQVAKDQVDGRCGVGYEDTFIGRYVEQACHSDSGVLE